jgi:peptidoglycan hydrolase-like protein with peptidoglycan-binding domain
MPTQLPAEAGMSAADRRQVQAALRRLEYYRGRADGIFGRGTRAAIRRFQQRIGAEATGRLTAEQANLLVSIP